MWFDGLQPHLFHRHGQDDVTTRAVRAALQPALEAWKELSGPHSKLRLAGLMVFHCALWRAFGTKDPWIFWLNVR